MPAAQRDPVLCSMAAAQRDPVRQLMTVAQRDPSAAAYDGRAT